MKSPVFLRRVVGHSMLPTLTPDQVVLVSGWLTPRTGDLVVAEVDGREVVKRVSSSNSSLVSLQSDNTNHGYYASVEPHSILGRVVKIV